MNFGFAVCLAEAEYRIVLGQSARMQDWSQEGPAQLKRKREGEVSLREE
jgi:hypothetical protein